MQWTEQLKKEYEKIAKENMKATQFGTTVSQKSDEPIRTDDKVAQDVDMGKTTYRKAEYIYKNADEDLIKQLDEGY